MALGLRTLKHQRVQVDLTETIKLLKGISDRNEPFFVLGDNPAMSDHKLKLKEPKTSK